MTAFIYMQKGVTDSEYSRNTADTYDQTRFFCALLRGGFVYTGQGAIIQ